MKAKGLFAATAAVLLIAVAPASAATNVVGHWSFDEGSGAKAADDSGLANHGTLEGAATWIDGKRGKALGFDGATARVRVPSTASLQPANVSVSAWVRSAGTPGRFKYLVAKGATSCIAAAYALYTGASGGLEFYVSANGGLTYATSSDAGQGVWDGAWHHVAGTFDGTAVRMYVDGVQAGSATPWTQPIDYATSTSSDLFVGHYAGCDGLDFPGAIDEPKVFNQALSPSEVDADRFYPFHGFLSPVNNEPTVNTSKAGSSIPVKFSLGASFGLGIMAVGSPASQAVACGSTAPIDAIEETVTAGASSLQYDAITGIYTYVWKTEKAWASSCRRLSVRLDDGSVHTASFAFNK
jgi:hypothetical protein